MKLAFIQAPAWGRDCPPYTMCSLAALVRQKGHKAYLFDLNNALYHASPCELKKMWDDKDYYSYWENREAVSALLSSNESILDFYIDKILNSEARIIGFTVHFSSAWASLEIARRIKERDKTRIIVFGGPDCSRQQKGDYFIAQDYVDIVVTGEGESPLLDIINKIDALDKTESIKGCLTLRNGVVSYGGYAPGVDNLDSLPPPDYSDFKDDIRSRLYREPHRLDIFDSRGCPTHCYFCSEWQFWGKFRAKSGKAIYKEVTRLMDKFPQVNYFYFIGSLVNGNMKSLGEFSDLIVRHKLKIQWAGQAVIRPEMTLDFLKKLKRSGCSWLGYGIESGSQRVLENMNKRFSLEVASAVLKETKEAGISTQANFMFGLPTETREDFNQTLEFLKENSRYMDSILASQSFCVIDKGTYLYNNPEEFGIRHRSHHLYWDSNSGENNYPERFFRYEEFCKVALSLGIPETSGVLKNKPDKWSTLGDYYLYRRDYNKAVENYAMASKYEIKNRSLLDKLSRCYEEEGVFDKAKQALGDGLKLKTTIGDRGTSDDKIKQDIARLDDISGYLKKVSNGNGKKQPEGIASLESAKLAKVLKYFSAIKYKGIDLDKILYDFDFNEKQRSMSRALYSHGLWVKLSNYILADVQKSRKDIILFGYPYWLVIDPCNFCNLSCPFCPTGQKREVRTKGRMKLDDFKAILDKLGPYLIHVDLVNWGEPLLNENIFDMVKHAKQYSADIKIDTNLTCLNEAGAEKLVKSGLDKIVVSMDGLNEDTYSKYRIGGDFKTVMGNLKLLLKKRKALRSSKPYITWQFLVFRHNEHEIDSAIKMGKKLGVDHVGITKAFIGDKNWIPLNSEYSNYHNETKESNLTFDYFKSNGNAFCNWPWEAVTINTNGSVSACCSVEEEKDDFGNFFHQPFEELWNSEMYQTARRHIKDKNIVNKHRRHICIECKHLGLINIDILSCHSFFD